METTKNRLDDEEERRKSMLSTWRPVQLKTQVKSVLDVFVHVKDLNLSSIVFSTIAKDMKFFIRSLGELGSLLAEIIYREIKTGNMQKEHKRQVKRRRLIWQIRAIFDHLSTSDNAYILGRQKSQQLNFWNTTVRYLKTHGTPVFEAYRYRMAMLKEAQIQQEKAQSRLLACHRAKGCCGGKKQTRSRPATARMVIPTVPEAPQANRLLFSTRGHINKDIQPFSPSSNWRLQYEVYCAQYYDLLYKERYNEHGPVLETGKEAMLYNHYISYYNHFMSK
ncbi:hypothetical protein NEHOM01_1575 [Nematocida homosporus]|uniref:uncharacterized protein n=1 Tax=Nematocida homosporus TaxID=1912981 RepID=UPI00221ECD79|nr:uncharacterized protein NEHOM01_1575 [Nematocida homosporus]KAI5186607.1 hypothetical protein NEHOM01_1575 [Nematocida homosporus]